MGIFNNLFDMRTEALIIYISTLLVFFVGFGYAIYNIIKKKSSKFWWVLAALMIFGALSPIIKIILIVNSKKKDEKKTIIFISSLIHILIIALAFTALIWKIHTTEKFVPHTLLYR